MLTVIHKRRDAKSRLAARIMNPVGNDSRVFSLHERNLLFQTDVSRLIMECYGAVIVEPFQEFLALSKNRTRMLGSFQIPGITVLHNDFIRFCKHKKTFHRRMETCNQVSLVCTVACAGNGASGISADTVCHCPFTADTGGKIR